MVRQCWPRTFSSDPSFKGSATVAPEKMDQS